MYKRVSSLRSSYASPFIYFVVCCSPVTQVAVVVNGRAFRSPVVYIRKGWTACCTCNRRGTEGTIRIIFEQFILTTRKQTENEQEAGTFVFHYSDYFRNMRVNRI